MFNNDDNQNPAQAAHDPQAAPSIPPPPADALDDFMNDSSPAAAPSDGSYGAGSPATAQHHDANSASPELDALKHKALEQLNPLLSHLEQTSEERFKTTMMMIQATDDQSLLQRAYDAANSIEDEKAKAQALLDVVNEINYFNQKAA